MDLIKNLILVIVFVVATYAWLVLFEYGSTDYSANFQEAYKDYVPESILEQIPGYESEESP